MEDSSRGPYDQLKYRQAINTLFRDHWAPHERIWRMLKLARPSFTPELQRAIDVLKKQSYKKKNKKYSIYCRSYDFNESRNYFAPYGRTKNHCDYLNSRHHLIPRSKGGSNHGEDNLIILPHDVHIAIHDIFERRRPHEQVLFLLRQEDHINLWSDWFYESVRGLFSGPLSSIYKATCFQPDYLSTQDLTQTSISSTPTLIYA